ncbi:type II toxin-antitoxin system VapC family toxin [Denitromonas iodatirespirans]|uniref:Type II toxin-antitoxin system VapC family toxin n=1 Tax=Denitromonas iodatirespirans TaxID=2795389 RepID=A0A944DTH0_DENI1|nr:type II toxin-antitoxin system VapC family toxin [Denitromonas iodatirespirans]MBT0964144.1 type II toxin-antitoxin system VapC family toxin [Denitromonas iodatirespirans]
MPFVLDNSVVAGWFLDDQASPYTDAIALRLEEDRAVVPALWQLEFANVLRTACRRKRLTAEQAQQVIEQICGLPIDIEPATPRPSELLALALRYDLSSYDAAYLELALRLQIPIATQDGPLRTAAEASGVGVRT